MSKGDAYKDENTVFFSKAQQSEFSALRVAIEGAIQIPSLAAIAAQYAEGETRRKSRLLDTSGDNGTDEVGRPQPVGDGQARLLPPLQDLNTRDAEPTEIGSGQLPVDPPPSRKDYWRCLDRWQKVLAVLICSVVALIGLAALFEGSNENGQDTTNTANAPQAVDEENVPFHSLCNSDQCRWVKIVKSEIVQAGTDGYGKDSNLFKILVDNGRSPTKTDDGSDAQADLRPLIKWRGKPAALYVLCSHAMPVVMANRGGKRGWVTDAIDFVHNDGGINPIPSSAAIWSKVCIGDPDAFTKSGFAKQNGITFGQPMDHEITFATPMDAWNGKTINKSPAIEHADTPNLPNDTGANDAGSSQPPDVEPQSCDQIQDQVSQLVQKNTNWRVLEIDNVISLNNIATGGGGLAILACEGDILADKGEFKIIYGLYRTPKNQTVIKYQISEL